MLPDNEALGIPFCGGYAAGYHAIQLHLRNTGNTIAEETKAFIHGEDVIKNSGYFSN
jgi:uncharacterized protein YjaZ